jgi:uncharacterized Zn-binding protein involved in type VI secretion
MPQPAAKEKDQVVATDTHVVQGTPTPMPFAGVLDGNLSPNATNTPAHAPVPDKPPSNRGTVVHGSATVLINWRAAARNGDAAKTCNDPEDLPVGTVVAASTVIVGG